VVLALLFVHYVAALLDGEGGPGDTEVPKLNIINGEDAVEAEFPFMVICSIFSSSVKFSYVERSGGSGI
jgi:hypothetical protein